jgi:hypothetical protein
MMPNSGILEYTSAQRNEIFTPILGSFISISLLLNSPPWEGGWYEKKKRKTTKIGLEIEDHPCFLCQI